MLSALAAPRAHAQSAGGLLLQGILDAELWSTDTLSNFLTRNRGSAGGVGRLTTWAALEPWRSFVLFGQTEIETGPATVEGGTEVYLDQAGIRYTRNNAFVVDAGKMPHVIGTFAGRRFSTRNPLIGQPDGYPLQYPVGAMVSGASTHWDYRAAVLSLPVTHVNYVPAPSVSYRPALGGGFTPLVGVRIGGSATWGPYLNRSLTTRQLNGASWRDYGERVIAADVEASHGYLETRAEISRSTYEVPRKPTITGTTYYGEAKYTLTPRLFVASRFERNAYPFIRPVNDSVWVSRLTDFHNLEVGLGVRPTASTLVKASYLWDHWLVTPENRAFTRPGGQALAVQLSQSFDAMDWIDRLRR
jgi:hypothetical protein